MSDYGHLFFEVEQLKKSFAAETERRDRTERTLGECIRAIDARLNHNQWTLGLKTLKAMARRQHEAGVTEGTECKTGGPPCVCGLQGYPHVERPACEELQSAIALIKMGRSLLR